MYGVYGISMDCQLWHCVGVGSHEYLTKPAPLSTHDRARAMLGIICTALYTVWPDGLSLHHVIPPLLNNACLPLIAQLEE